MRVVHKNDMLFWMDKLDQIDDYEERAAWFQYCLGLERQHAERLAWAEVYGD